MPPCHHKIILLHRYSFLLPHVLSPPLNLWCKNVFFQCWTLFFWVKMMCPGKRSLHSQSTVNLNLTTGKGTSKDSGGTGLSPVTNYGSGTQYTQSDIGLVSTTISFMTVVIINYSTKGEKNDNELLAVCTYYILRNKSGDGGGGSFLESFFK